MVESKGISPELTETDVQKIINEIDEAVRQKDVDAENLARLTEELLTAYKLLSKEVVAEKLTSLIRSNIKGVFKRKLSPLRYIHSITTLQTLEKEMKTKRTEGGGKADETILDASKMQTRINDIRAEMFSNSLLPDIFFVGDNLSDKVEAVNKEGQREGRDIKFLTSRHTLSRDVKKALAEQFGVESDEVPKGYMDSEIILSWLAEKKAETKDLKELSEKIEIILFERTKKAFAKRAAETAAKKEREREEAKPKPPTPSPEKIEESRNQAKERERKELNEKLTALEKRLDGSNKENFNEWKRLMNAINKSEDALKTALKKRNRKFEFIMGRKPILALMNSFSKKEKEQVSEDNIGDRLRQKLAEISKIAGEEKEKLAPKKPIKPAPEKAGAKVEEQESFGDRAERLVPKEYTAWKKLFISLHYGDPNLSYPPGYITAQGVLELIEVNASVDIEKLQEAMKQQGWSAYIETKDPAAALESTLQKQKVTDENLGDLTKNAVKEIMAIVKKALTTFEPHLLHRPPPDRGIVPKPPAVTSLQDVINKQPSEEKAFFEAMATYVSDKPEKQAFFVQMMIFLEMDKGGNKDIETLQKKMTKHLRLLRKLSAEALKNETLLENLFNSVSPLKSEMEKALQDQEELKQETEKQKYLLLMQNQALKVEFNKLFEIINMKPENIDDEDARHNLKEVQEVCQKFLDGIDHEALKNMDLNERQKDIDELKKKFKENVEPHINTLKKIVDLPAGLRPAAPAATDSAASASSPAAGPAAPAAGLGTPPAAPADSTSTPTPSTEPIQLPTVTSTPETILTVKEIKGFEIETAALLRTVLRNKRTLDPKLGTKKPAECLSNPTYLAINAAIKKAKKEKGFDIKALIYFLQNPKLMNESINEDAVKAAITAKGAKNLKELILALENEAQDNEKFEKRITGRRPTPDEQKKLNEIDERTPILRKLLSDAKNLKKLKSRNLDYQSPRHVLALIHFFPYREDDTDRTDQINQEIGENITTQKENLIGWLGKLDGFGFVFKPTLKSTLKGLAQDKEFASLGEKPDEELAKLAGLFENDPQKVGEWIKNLPGGFEKHIHTTVPRLIAYLEMAIRDGKVSYLFKTGRTLDLVNHLKKIQHEQLMKEIDKEFRENPTMEVRDKTIRYFERMQEVSEASKDISAKILRNNMLKSVGLRGSAAIGMGAAAIFSPLPILATLPALVSAPSFIASYMKSTPVSDKNKEIMRRASIRALVGNGLALSGAALGGLIAAPVALPLGIAGAVAGALSPELLKHRKAIYERGKPVAKFTYQKILPTAIKIPWWFIKYTVGLPAVISYRGTKRFLNK